MDYFFRFAFPQALYVLVPLVIIVALIRLYWFRGVHYRYSQGALIKAHGMGSSHPYKKVFFVLRACLLTILALLVARPQLVDERSKIDVEGIDIVLVLDASGSMQLQDYSDDKRSRFQVAKDEAVRFVGKRTNDALGLVVFGKDALSRCPITHDKEIVSQMIGELQLGDIDPDGTVLCTAMVTAMSRLKYSQSKSKIMIVLTDGEPSDGDMDPNVMMQMAQKLGIKIYTVGIGSEKDQYMLHPFYGRIAMPKVNRELLEKTANATGGQFFLARDEHDMRRIYDTIDQLEKTEHEAPIFSRYHDLCVPFIAAVIGLIAVEIVVATFIWFGL